MPTTIPQHTTAPRTCRETYADKTDVIPIEFMSGLFSMFPDTPWISHCVGNNSRGELRSVGTVALPQEAISFDSSCSLHFMTDVDCTLEIFQLLRDFYQPHMENVTGENVRGRGNFVRPVIKPSHHTPTWNSISADRKWTIPGGIDKTDARLIGVVQIKTGQVGELTITGEKLFHHLTGCVNDGKLNRFPCWGLLVRRCDVGPQTVNITGELKIERNIL